MIKKVVIWSLGILFIVGFNLWLLMLRAKRMITDSIVNGRVVDTVGEVHNIEVKFNAPHKGNVDFVVRDLGSQNTQGMSVEQIKALTGGVPTTKTIAINKGSNVFNLMVAKFDLQGQGQVTARGIQMDISSKFIKEYSKTVVV
jgi:hypothetical protein